MWIIRTIVFAGLVCLASSADAPRFDSATIVRSRSGDEAYQVRMQFKPGPAKVTMRNVNLRQCVQQAYRLNEYQVSGTTFSNKVRFDIEARMSRADGQDA